MGSRCPLGLGAARARQRAEESARPHILPVTKSTASYTCTTRERACIHGEQHEGHRTGCAHKCNRTSHPCGFIHSLTRSLTHSLNHSPGNAPPPGAGGRATGGHRAGGNRATGGHPGKRTAAGSGRPCHRGPPGGGKPGYWGPPRKTHRRRELDTATATRYWEPPQETHRRREQETATATGYWEPPGKRTAAGSRRPQPQRATRGHLGKRTAAGSRRPQPQRATWGHPGKRTAAGSRRLSPNGFHLPDRNPVRQSLIREKTIHKRMSDTLLLPQLVIQTAVNMKPFSTVGHLRLFGSITSLTGFPEHPSRI